MNTAKRLGKELADVTKSPPAGTTCGQENASNLYLWTGTIAGPAGTPFAGGTFRFHITFPENYPSKPPIFAFSTKIYHPNVEQSTGVPCLDVINGWSPVSNVIKILNEVVNRMKKPNPAKGIDDAITKEFTTNFAQWEAKARQWTQEYAQ